MTADEKLDTLTALVDELAAYGNSTTEEAEHVMATVLHFWRFPLDTLPRIVAAIGDHRAAALLWLYWTAEEARKPNGGELILYAAVKVAAARGVSEELLEKLQAHVARVH